MKIIADDKIPLIAELFGIHAQVIQRPGPLITHDDLKDADVLLVRTVTDVSRELLAGTSIKFVGSATAGIDHLDCDWLDQSRIRWSDAKGANAQAVADYVLACIAALQSRNWLSQNPKIGIIGVGEIGRKVLNSIQVLGYEYRLNDPLRDLIEPEFQSTPLEDFADLDLICIHTPLTTEGDFPTHHLIDEAFLKRLNPRSVIVNAARGGIIDELALLNLEHKPTVCLDVWENEPNLNLNMLRLAKIATPHIAGYSQEAKYRATLMLYESLRPLFNLPEIQWGNWLSSSSRHLDLQDPEWGKTVLSLYNPFKDTEKLKSILLNTVHLPESFEQLRREYVLRSEFAA